ncbi:MAG: hypothetical protein K6A44_03210 [bacterium]|nr:hypothetical protein [bacterium]
MAQAWFRVRVPRVAHFCCGQLYDTKNIKTLEYFRCFAHKSIKNSIQDNDGVLKKVKFCITVWLVCKNNNCITSFTFFYDNTNRLITKKQTRGLKYLLKIKDKFLDNIPLKVKIPKVEISSKKYLWRYVDAHPTKKFVSNIYNLDNKKVGETLPQPVIISNLTKM